MLKIIFSTTKDKVCTLERKIKPKKINTRIKKTSKITIVLNFYETADPIV